MEDNGVSDASEVEVSQAAVDRILTIRLLFDPDSQELRPLDFDPTRIRTWNMVLAILEMARVEADGRIRAAQAASIQEALMQQANQPRVQRGIALP